MAAHDCTYTNGAASALNLNDGSTYVLENIEGIWSAETVAVYTELPTVLPAGVIEYHNRTERLIRLSIRVALEGKTDAQIATNARALIAHFYSDPANNRRGTLQYEAANNVVRAIKGAMHKANEVDYIRPGVPERVIVELLCDDPSFYNPTPGVYNGALSGVAAVNVACTNSGDCDAYPQILIEDQATTVKITDAYGYWCQFVDSLADGDDLDCDFDPLSKSFLEDDGTDWKDQREAGSALLRVKPGTANMVFQGGNAGDDATLTVTVYHRYSSHG